MTNIDPNDPDGIGAYYKRKAEQYKQAAAAYEQAKRTHEQVLACSELLVYSTSPISTTLLKHMHDWLNWSADELRRLKQRMEDAGYVGD